MLTTASRRRKRSRQIEKVLKDLGKDYEFHTYEGAGHAFFSTDRTSYRPEAANDGWQRVFDWFGRYLPAEQRARRATTRDGGTHVLLRDRASGRLPEVRRGLRDGSRSRHATVYFDHPYHSPYEHTLNIDFANTEQGPSSRVAVELDRELCPRADRAHRSCTRSRGAGPAAALIGAPERRCDRRSCSLACFWPRAGHRARAKALKAPATTTTLATTTSRPHVTPSTHPAPARPAPTTTAPPTTVAPSVTTAPPDDHDDALRTTTAPPPPPTTSSSLLVNRLIGVGDARQVVAVVADGYGDTTATLTAYQKSASGWTQVFGPWIAEIGEDGFAPPGEKSEGDLRTPSGSYGFGFFFGIDADPGVMFPWRADQPSDVWDDDPSSPNYNEWIDEAVQGAAAAGADPEPMNDYPVLRIRRGDRLQHVPRLAHPAGRERHLLPLLTGPDGGLCRSAGTPPSSSLFSNGSIPPTIPGSSWAPSRLWCPERSVRLRGVWSERGGVEFWF